MLITFNLNDNAICGYHIYKDVRPNPFVGDVVCCEREERNAFNAFNPFTVALKKAGIYWNSGQCST